MRALRIHKFAQNGALKLDQIPISITSTKQVPIFMEFSLKIICNILFMFIFVMPRCLYA